MNQVILTINFEEVLGIIKKNSYKDYVTTKAEILDQLNIEDTKGNRKLLNKAIKHLKERKQIYTTFAISEDEPGYRGRGYMYNYEEDPDAED